MKKEVKIGIFAIAMIGAAWAGIRFLQGFDIFRRNVEYYAAYDRVNGVQSASPVLMQGVKIGTVTNILFDPAQSDKVLLQLTIQRRYRIPSDSEAKISSDGLLGGKAIEITYGTSPVMLERGDTLHSVQARDLMDMAGSELDFFKEKIALLTADLSRTLGNLNNLMEQNAGHIAGTMEHLDALSGDLAGLMQSERASLQKTIEGLSAFADHLSSDAPRIDSILGHLDQMTGQLAEEEFAKNLAGVVTRIDTLLAAVEQGDGTVGKLLYDAELYGSLNDASEQLAQLLADLKAHPARYVHFSLFGRNPDKADRKAAKAETDE